MALAQPRQKLDWNKQTCAPERTGRGLLHLSQPAFVVVIRCDSPLFSSSRVAALRRASRALTFGSWSAHAR
jgi:hypothetical protein